MHILGEDWAILDTKSLSRLYKDLPMISEMKKIHLKHSPALKAVVVKGSKYFNYEDETETFANLVKRGISQRRLQNVDLKLLPLSHEITKEKKDDVEKLLQCMYGNNWQNLDESSFGWYKDIIYNLPSARVEPEEINYCDCLDIETSVRV